MFRDYLPKMNPSSANFSNEETANEYRMPSGEKNDVIQSKFRLPALPENLSWSSLGKMSFQEIVGPTLKTSNAKTQCVELSAKQTLRSYHSTPNCKLVSRDSNSNSTSTESLPSTRSRSNLPRPRRVPLSEVNLIQDDDDSSDDTEDGKRSNDKPQIQKDAPSTVKVISNLPAQTLEFNSSSHNPLQDKNCAKFPFPTQKQLTNDKINAPVETSLSNNLPNSLPMAQNQQHCRQVQFMIPTPSASSQMSYLPSPQLPLNEVIMVKNKPYIVLSLIGRGGSSKVYLAYEQKTKSLLAIKCVELDVNDDSLNSAYKNEICLLQKLQYSDRVITLHEFEFSKDKNCLYVVMEKGDTDLSSVIRTYAKDGQLTSEMIKFYWSEMLKCVAVIHKEGIIHSDLKPANFLLVGGRMKLIDFGIASSLQTDMTSVIKDVQAGTYNYMSPEAIQDTTQAQDYDGRRQQQPLFKINVKSDVWSLGCILYNLVYGKTPFQDIRQPVAKMQAIVNPNYDIKYPDKPNKQLIEVMKKCLVRDPKQRSSIQDLLNHPYLQEPTNVTSSPQSSDLSSTLKQLAALTPNSAEKEILQLADNIRKKHHEQ